MTSELEEARARQLFDGATRPEFADPAGPGQESVWDYPRPPRLEPDLRHVEVFADGVSLAASERVIRLLETASPPTFYIHPDDVRRELLIPGPGDSVCEWKGRAAYWSLVMGDVTVANVAWSYPDPCAEFAAIADYIAFFPRKVECFVLGVPVVQQPGRRYGGWVTPEIVGPFKGAPGTESW